MSKLTHKDNNYTPPFPPAPPFSVWQIMRSSVNDNSPGYRYWLVRIAIASSLCAVLIYIFLYILS